MLVPFPFTDQTTSKRRPAVVVSSRLYHQKRPDLILMAVTSQIKSKINGTEILVEFWQEASLIKPSIIKPVFTTIEKNLVQKKLGTLNRKDQTALQKLIQKLIGPD